MNRKDKKGKIKISLSPGNFVPILLVSFLALAFSVGVLWQKVHNLEKDGIQAAGAVGSPQAPPAAPEVGDVDPITDDDYVRGSRDARIVLIGYSDLECPFCKRFHPTARQVVDEYNGQVMWVYRHFPLEQLHSKAPKEAEAAECAGKIGGNEGFWALTDKIFEVTPANNGLDLADLPDLASEVGLDKEEFQNCLDSGEMAQKVEDDYQSGTKAGITGTPGNILLDTKTGKTQLIPGAVPYEQLKQAIDALLET